MDYNKNKPIPKFKELDKQVLKEGVFGQVKKCYPNKKGSVMLYLSFIFIAIIIILIATIFAPMGVLMNTQLYQAGEKIMLQANDSIANINDSTIRAEIQGVITTGLSNQENNIAVNSAIFQYSWIFVLGLTALIIFIQTRRLVEYGGGGIV